MFLQRTILPVREHELQHVCAHLQGFQAGRLRIVVNVLVFPAVAKVALVGVIKDQPAFPEQSESLCRQPVMFVDLRQAIRKIEWFMIKRETYG